MIPTPALACLALFAQITVDDDGPAMFADLPAAVAFAGSGDTILVQPGSYSAFTTGKRLTILGPAAGPRPFVDGESIVQGASEFTVAGIQFRDLICEDVAGRLSVDDCVIGLDEVVGAGELDTFRVTNCDQVVVSRSVLQGKTGNDDLVESPGLHVEDSNVAVVDCQVFGGEGGLSTFAPCGYPGQPGIRADDGSRLIVAGTSIQGGDGNPDNLFFGCVGGDGGPAIRAFDSTVIVRGSSSDLLAHGAVGADHAILGFGGTATVSGVTLSPNSVSPGLTAVFPAPAEPYLEVQGQRRPRPAAAARPLRSPGPAGPDRHLADALPRWPARRHRPGLARRDEPVPALHPERRRPGLRGEQLLPHPRESGAGRRPADRAGRRAPGAGVQDDQSGRDLDPFLISARRV